MRTHQELHDGGHQTRGAGTSGSWRPLALVKGGGVNPGLAHERIQTSFPVRLNAGLPAGRGEGFGEEERKIRSP